MLEKILFIKYGLLSWEITSCILNINEYTIFFLHHSLSCLVLNNLPLKFHCCFVYKVSRMLLRHSFCWIVQYTLWDKMLLWCFNLKLLILAKMLLVFFFLTYICFWAGYTYFYFLIDFAYRFVYRHWNEYNVKIT